MRRQILPYLVTKSQEKLTDRGSLAVLDEFMTGIGLPTAAARIFPTPGSGRGIDPVDFIRTLVYHFADGGRHLEGINAIRSDAGFRSLIQMKRMPTADTVGDWLRRMGDGRGREYVQHLNDLLVRQYTRVSTQEEYVLDVDSTLIEANKGDGTYSYKGIQGYHPMLGWLSDGRDEPICSSVKFRPGYASAQTDILEALQHTETLIPEGKRIRYFRSDSAAYQAKIIEYCHENDLYYSITADQDVSVRAAILNIPATAWKPLRDRRDGFTTGREVAETIHTLNHSSHSFRLIVIREVQEKPDLFGAYRYYALVTNIPADGWDGKSAEEVVWHHHGRGNCERYIEDTKYGLTLKYVPCGQLEANAMYYALGMVTFNLLKLMQMMVLPASWVKRTVLSLRRDLFRFVAKVTKSGHRIFLKINLTAEEIRQWMHIREKIWALRLHPV